MIVISTETSDMHACDNLYMIIIYYTHRQAVEKERERAKDGDDIYYMLCWLDLVVN